MMPTAAKIERTVYGASAAALAVLPQLGADGVHTSVALAGGGCAWWLYQRVKSADFQRVMRTAQRALPVLTGAGIYAAAAMADGTAWWEYATPAAWAGLMCSWLPVSRAAWALPEARAVAALPAAPEPAPAPAGSGFEVMWAERVAGPDGAIPGSRVARIAQQPGKVTILAEVPAGQVARVDHARLCSAFGVDPAELRLVAETRGREALVTLYDKSPLIGMRKATRALVTPDADGYWTIGTAHDGTDAKARLFGPTGALHSYLVGVTGSGKTVALILCLAAEANAGAVSWLASMDPDAQLAAAGAYVDRQGSGRTYALRASRAAVALMRIRGQINAEVGHDFSPASPYPLLVLSLDEFNGLADDSEEGREIARNAVYIVERGRKYGVAFRYGGQTLDLARIGGDRSLREQTRSGTGIVLRTVSGISGRQATEGMLPEGVSLADIPATIGGGASLADRMSGKAAAVRGESTAGMGHVLAGGSAPSLMRALYVHLPKDGSTDGLGDIFPTSGVNTLTPREIEALGGLYGDWTGDDDEDGAMPQDAAVRPQKATVKDQVLAVLTREMTAKEIRQAVDAAAGTIRNTLSELADAGLIVRTDTGSYAPAGG